MRKKYLSALLFGALVFASAGTFTSCKDYDDDIAGLQSQIDKLATKEDMEAKLAQMQAALDAAIKTAEDAKTTAEKALEAAGSTEEINKLKEEIAKQADRIKALEDAKVDVEALKKEISESVDAQLDTFRTEMDELIKEVEGLVGKLADMVTSVELVYSSDKEVGGELVFSTAEEQDNVFSKGVENAITFTKGKQVQTGDKFVVRVSPTNAVLTPEMISLVNSQGKKLDDFLAVSKVERFNGLLSRAEGNNGLWEVSVELKNYDQEGFENITTTENGTKKILFAVEVNNTLSTASTREVISSYDLTMDWSKYNQATQLNYFVNETNVANIQNRFGKVAGLTEKTWKGTVAAVEGTDQNTKKDDSDDRSMKSTANAVQGQPITIALSKSASEVESPSNIRAMYVVLDEAYAYESAPSEINAWKSYTYTGLNTVVEGTSTQITIDSKTAINDVIGFRVFAVNYDGTLVDPDGKAFYVKVGDKATEWNTVNTNITPNANAAIAVDMNQSKAENVTLSKLENATTATWTTDKIEDLKDSPVFMAYFVDKDGNELFNTNSMLNFVKYVDFSKVAKVYTRPTGSKWYLYEDDKTYNGKLEIKNNDGLVLATLDVTMTKTLPTALPEGFSFKDKQVIDGVYNCYMIANVWDAEKATTGKMPMENFINFGKGIPSQYEATFANSKVVNNKPESITVNGGDKDGIVVDKSYIDNKTEHETTIVYNYGKISSKKNAQGGYDDVTIVAEKIKTIYNCFYKEDVHTWAWASKENLGITNPKAELPYSTDLVYGTKNEKEPTSGHIFGQNKIDGEFSKLLSEVYANSLAIKDAKLTSDATGKEDYFKVDFTKDVVFTPIKTDIGSNPKADVPSTLTINCKDSYGHDVVIKLKMTVKPRK